MHRLVSAALLAALLLGACEGAPALEAETTPTATRRPSSTPTLAPSPTATPWPTEWPTLAAATLAPYPISELNSELEAAEGEGDWRVASFGVPLALNPHDHFYFARPVAANTLNYELPSFRYGELNTASSVGGHTGVDFSVDVGTPVLAAASGEVMFSDYGLLHGYRRLDDPYGLAILIRHDFSFEGAQLFTVYAHLSRVLVEYGQQVEAGEVIGQAGSSGMSTGPHLHFEVRLARSSIYTTYNPELWLSPPQDSGLLVGRVLDNLGRPMPGRLVEVTQLDTGRRFDAYTYATEISINRDPYYGENFVLSDLPAGRYEIAISFLYAWRRVEVEINPGQVTFFTFQGIDEYAFDLPRGDLPPNVP